MTNNRAGNIVRNAIRSFGPTPFTFDELYAKLVEMAEGYKREPKFLNKLIVAQVTTRMIEREQVKFKLIRENTWGYILTDYLPEGETKSSFGRPAHVKVVNFVPEDRQARGYHPRPQQEWRPRTQN